jgi:hypothetical protein
VEYHAHSTGAGAPPPPGLEAPPSGHGAPQWAPRKEGA